MNPWRKRRRQLLRRQNEGSYSERMIRLADLGITVTITVPFIRRINANGSEETDAELISRAYGHPETDESVRQRLLAVGCSEAKIAGSYFLNALLTRHELPPRGYAHDPSEFYTLDTP